MILKLCQRSKVNLIYTGIHTNQNIVAENDVLTFCGQSVESTILDAVSIIVFDLQYFVV